MTTKCANKNFLTFLNDDPNFECLIPHNIILVEKIIEFYQECDYEMKQEEELEDEVIIDGDILDRTLMKHFATSNIKFFLMSFACVSFADVTKEANSLEFMESINISTRLRMLLLKFRRVDLVGWWDEYIRGALKVWANWVERTNIPRPSKFGLLDPPENLTPFYFSYLNSFTIMTSIPQTDIIIFSAFMKYQKAAIDQLVDYTLHSIDLHSTRRMFFHDEPGLASSLLNSIIIAALRMIRLFSYCKSTWKRVYSKNILRATNLQKICQFEEYLLKDKEFIMRESTLDKRVYISSSLVNSKEKTEFFHNTCCEIGLQFEEEFIVIIQRQSNSEEFNIIVDGRNMCRKSIWVGNICQKFGFIPIEDFSYLDPFFAKWKQEVSFSLYVILLCMLRHVDFIERELPKSLPIKEMHQMYSMALYCGLCLHDFYLASDSPFSPILWRICSLVCAKWIKGIADNLRLIDASERPSIISVLNRLNKFLYQCPQKQWIHFQILYSTLLSLKKEIYSVTYYDEYTKFFLDRTLLCHFQNFMTEDDRPHDKLIEGQGLINPHMIGRGSFGTVYRCFDLEKNRTVVVKEIYIDQRRKPLSKDMDLLKEANYLKFLKHPLTVEIYNVFATKECIYITMEHCDGGTLSKKIAKEGPMDDNLFRFYAVGLIKAFCLLHCNNIVHGDLKPSNIMIDQYGYFKLGDFGAAEQLVRTHSSNSSSPGTILYAAPEVLTKGKRSLMSDMWSLGCVFFFMKTGLNPWHEYRDPTTIICKMGNGAMFDLSPLEQVHPEIVKIIKSCLQFDPAKRPLANSILLNSFLFNVGD